MSRKFKFLSNLTRITGISREGQYNFFFSISRSFLLRMRIIVEKIKTYFMFNNFF